MDRLAGIAPNGKLTFMSSLYSGCMSDIEIRKLSGLLDLLEPGDQIMADKGVILNKLLEKTWVSIATPHFLLLRWTVYSITNWGKPENSQSKNTGRKTHQES